ncbi:hypothetical protein [Microvirga pudoricolor]|uniref:hypothetical protein n=1 Tax=Microvirga pudoricolor TaxID=2778729 RepID=UPI001950F88E|nr:hypothetical protein [Microvirga pudoricolor]MBM6594712.1 hypothetical protein [Microvirga pudoricolor]
MTDVLPADASATDPSLPTDHGRLQDRVREAIRAEIALHDPTDDARRPLELIAETFVRAILVEDRLTIRVVDARGEVRTKDEDGRTVELTLRDLIEELHVRHPAMFRHRQEAGKEPGSPPAAPLDESRRGSAAAPVTTAHRDPGSSLRLSDEGAPSRPDRAAPESLDRARILLEDMRDDRPRPWFLMAAAAAVLLILGVGAFMAWERFPFAAQDDEPVAMGSPPAEPSTTGAVASPPAAAEPVPLKGAAEAIDTATLRMQGRIVRLFGVEWAEGGGKPEDLTTYLNGREVACEPAGATDVYRCQVSGQDLSRVVLFNGGGRTTSQATDELKAAEAKARESKLGVWSR